MLLEKHSLFDSNSFPIDYDLEPYREFDLDKAEKRLHIVEGLFDIQAISREVASTGNSVCFVSGPPNMIHAFQNELGVQGFPSESIIIDAWE